MVHTKINSKDHLYEFGDIIEFAEYANRVPEGKGYFSRKQEIGEWAGGSFDDAIRQAKTGNPELVKSMFDGANIISAMIEYDKIGEVRDVTGEYFDVSDYLSGEPEVFRRIEYGEKKPVVPLYASFAMSCDISNRIITNRGCAIVALCDELANTGFIVDLNLVQVSCYGGSKYYTKIHVGIDPLEIDTVAFIVANPLCLRRLWLAAFELYVNEKSPFGHGSPREYDLHDIFDSGFSGFYFQSSNGSLFNESNYDSLDSSKRHVMNMVDEFKKNSAQVILG